jgi:hypothetical protein
MSKIAAVLTIMVIYEDETGEMFFDQMIEEAKKNLTAIANNAASNGLMTSDSSMTVETWDSKVETKVIHEP